MDLYDQVKKQWQMWSVRSGEDLDLRLDNFRILFAYNSGKIENAAISYHDTREIFENGRVVGYTGDPRTLFELQNQKVCYDFLREKIPVKEPLSIPLILEIHRALTEGTYDARRYLVNGERPGTFKKHDYVTGIHEVGSYPEEVEGDLAELIGEATEDEEQKPAKPARKTAAKKTAAKAAEKAEPAKAEAPAEEKPAAEKPKRKCAPRKKAVKETV